MTNNLSNEPKTDLVAYLFFLTGQWVSILGSNIVRFGIIWFLAKATGSPFILALAAFFNFAPFIVVTPVAGVFIDRWSRKKVIIFVDFVQALITVILIAAFLSNAFSNLELIGIILFLSIISGCFGAFHNSAVSTLLPIMVPQTHLSRVNGINYLVNGGIQIVGPLIGAVALDIMPLQQLLWLDAITFIIAIIPTAIISIPTIKKQIKEKQEKSSFRAEFVEGIQFISATNGLLALLAVFTGANFFFSPLFTQIPIIVSDIHLGNEDALAFAMAMQQGGMLLGSLIMSSWKGFENHAKGVFIGLFIGYIGMYVILLAPLGNFIVLGIGMFITGFVLPIANVSSETIWAKTVPKEILGRVYASRQTIAQISAPAGMLLAGLFAEIFGVISVLVIAASGGALLLLYAWFFTKFSRVEKLVEESTETKITMETPTLSEG